MVLPTVAVAAPVATAPVSDDRLVVSRSELRQELSRLIEDREQPTVG